MQVLYGAVGHAAFPTGQHVWFTAHPCMPAAALGSHCAHANAVVFATGKQSGAGIGQPRSIMLFDGSELRHVTHVAVAGLHAGTAPLQPNCTAVTEPTRVSQPPH